jgi:MFS family permease
VTRTRIAITLCFFADGAVIGTLASRLPGIQAQTGLGNAQLGAALFAMSVGAMATMPVAGWLSDRFGSGRTSVLALITLCIGLVLAGRAHALASLAAGLLVAGAGFGAANVAINAQGLALERRHDRRILSFFHAAFSFGGLAGAGIGALAAWADIRPVVHLIAVAAVLATAVVAAGPQLLPAAAQAGEASKTLGLPPRPILLLGVAAFCCLLAEGSAADWSGVYLSKSAGATAGVAALGYSAFALAMACSRLIGDRLTGRLGPAWLVRAGALLAASGLCVSLAVGSVGVGLAGFACMGAGLGVVVPVLFRAAGTTPGVSAGVGVAAVSTLGWLGFLAGPPAIGLTAHVVGLRAALGLVVVAVLVLASLARLTGRRRIAPEHQLSSCEVKFQIADA